MAVRDGSTPPASDKVQGVQAPVQEAADVLSVPVQRWYTPEIVGAIIGVQGQRIRQIVRQLKIGTKLGNQWLLDADDLSAILKSRQPKETASMAPRKTAQMVALEGLSRIATRIERVEKAVEEMKATAWEHRKLVLGFQDQLNGLDRKLMDCLEPKRKT